MLDSIDTRLTLVCMKALASLVQLPLKVRRLVMNTAETASGETVKLS